MNIKTRLSIQFTILVAVVLLFFSLLVYYFSYSSQRAKFRETLLDKAKNTAILLIDVAEVDSSLLKKIHQSTILLKDEEIALTDSAHNLIYSNDVNYLTDRIILTNSEKGSLSYFSISGKDGVCYFHEVNNKSYYVLAMAFDISRTENLRDLRGILLWSILFSIWLSVLVSYLFSRRAIKPISEIIRSVKDINSAKLGNRLDEGKRKDEIDQLAITFNELLTNLEIVFRNQEDFVSNASHEFRTPLSIMISETDYLLSREHTREEYVKHLKGLVEDTKSLNSLVNSLLELAQLNRDNRIQFTTVRIDEIVYTAIHQIKLKYKGRKIVIKIHYPDNESDLEISGNHGLLVIAFKNLLDNACKFSGQDVIIEFLIAEKEIKVIISDKGIGIPPAELDRIYRPFQRASNVRFKGGFGIGLSLVSKITELHNVVMIVESAENEGTKIELIFRRLN